VKIRSRAVRLWDLRRSGRVLIPAAVLAGLVFTAGGASGATPSCSNGEYRTVEVGIVKAIGCWTESTQEGATVYTARFQDQEQGIDLNGFVLTGPTGGALTINAGTREVTTAVSSESEALSQAQLNSSNWPVPGQLAPIGEPIKLDFEAPEKSELELEDLRLGSNETFNRALAGLSPVGNVETPIVLEEEGKGSMDLTVELTGAFSLKGKPQSVTIDLPTESEHGTKLDGFDIDLKEIDGFKVITINDLEARYSAANQVIAGSASATFPFTKPGKNGVGFGVGFALENGALTEVKANVHGLSIPIGAPPGGFVTEVGGGFRLKNLKEGGSEILVMANLGANFGPEIPTPFGKQAPISVEAALQLGNQGHEFFFKISGGVQIFRLPVGNVFLAIYSNAGVQFGAGIGIGFPSFRNNERDPFYIGARVEGWVSKGEFQFEGKGSVALIGVKIFEGRILVNNKAAGACWRVLGVPGGAVYVYGSPAVKTFGIGCGLDDYKEKFPANARVSAAEPRKIRLTDKEVILAARGAGRAPRFAMRSAGGRVLRTPVGVDGVRRKDNAVFVNEGAHTTYVVLPHPKGIWTILPYEGSATITDLKSGRRAPMEHVKASVQGRGAHRTLVWSSLNRPHTRLLFTERLANGVEVPVLETGKAGGRHRFTVKRGGGYGTRAMRVIVVHGYGSRQAGVVDRYQVHPPRRLPAPREVRAWRDVHTAQVTWSRVRGAHGYLVEISTAAHGKRVVNFVRRTSPKQRRVSIRSHPGGNGSVARVFAVGADDRLGHSAKRAYATNPSANTLRQAARRSAASAVYRHGGVNMRLRCPEEGHCRTVVELRRGRRVLRKARFQLVPDTFDSIRLELPPGATARVRNGRGFQVVVRMRRIGERAAARGDAKR